jgi:Mitochondrial branched-chain alpha-ketoacid dehydrogenase kinase
MSEERLIKVRRLYLTVPRPTLLQSANYVRTELPVRIAHRIRDLQDLPYIVVMQEGVAKVYEVRYTVLRPTS